MYFKRVSFAVDELKQCEAAHHNTSAEVTTFLCTCGKLVCSKCRQVHIRTAKAHRCKVVGHVKVPPEQEAPVHTCSCRMRVCTACTDQHLTSDAAHQCQSPYHNKLNSSLCSKCTCGKQICDTCMPLHYLQSIAHMK